MAELEHTVGSFAEAARYRWAQRAASSQATASATKENTRAKPQPAVRSQR